MSVVRDRVLEAAFQRWRRESDAADPVDFEAGWREALGTLPSPSGCECLTCREVAERFKLAMERLRGA